MRFIAVETKLEMKMCTLLVSNFRIIWNCKWVNQILFEIKCKVMKEFKLEMSRITENEIVDQQHTWFFNSTTNRFHLSNKNMVQKLFVVIHLIFSVIQVIYFTAGMNLY